MVFSLDKISLFFSAIGRLESLRAKYKNDSGYDGTERTESVGIERKLSKSRALRSGR